MSATQVENRLVRETLGIRLEMAELRSETRTAITEVHTAIGGRDEGGFREGAQRDRGLHGQISAQTRWMLGGLAAAVTLYPIITKLVGRLIP